MCRVSYTANFEKTEDCPSPIEKTKVSVHFSDNHHERYDSLLDLWSRWYRDYWTSEEPRLILRYEDLLFDTKDTLRDVCHCVGGTFKEKGFDHIASAAKGQTGDGRVPPTDRQAALAKYASPTYRHTTLTEADRLYYNRSIDYDLAEALHYRLPLLLEQEKEEEGKN